MSKQEKANELRRQYMSGEITFDEHYLQLAELCGVDYNRIPFNNSTVKAALTEGDVHLNTLPLNAWDRCHPVLTEIASSLSDTVCVLKTLARKRANETTAS